MQNLYVFIFLLIIIQTISSFEINNDDQNENIRQISTLPYHSSLSSDFLSDIKQGNGPQCLSKNLLLNIFSRTRRASISRPYFQHWRGSRDNSRFISKNLLAFSPRLGKRADEEDNNKSQIDGDNTTPDLNTFLIPFVQYLQSKKIDIIYEDATKICLSEGINDSLIKEISEKFDNNRRQQEEARERQSKVKHPLLFRYRLG